MAEAYKPIADKRLQLMAPFVPDFGKSLELISASQLPQVAKVFASRIITSGHVNIKQTEKGPIPILSIADFYNHVVDPDLAAAIGEYLGSALSMYEPDFVATVATSGVYPSIFAAKFLKIPLLVAKKDPSAAFDELVSSGSESFTSGKSTTINVDRASIRKMSGKRGVVIDDVLAQGNTISSLYKLLRECDLDMMGFGVPINKAFEKGYGHLIRDCGLLPSHIHTILNVDELTEQSISIQGVGRLAFRGGNLTHGQNIWQAPY